MLLSSRRALATFLSVMLLTLALALADERPAVAVSDDSDITVFRDGPDVAYPLRHDFSMAIGLPGHGKHEPTSCYDTWGDNYLCRIVSGYEETGDERNFLVRAKDALDTAPSPASATNSPAGVASCTKAVPSGETVTGNTPPGSRSTESITGRMAGC